MGLRHLPSSCAVSTWLLVAGYRRRCVSALSDVKLPAGMHAWNSQRVIRNLHCVRHIPSGICLPDNLAQVVNVSVLRSTCSKCLKCTYDQLFCLPNRSYTVRTMLTCCTQN
jgi:hypothetical protein